MAAAVALVVALSLSSLPAAAQTRPRDIPPDLWSAFKAQAAPEGLATVGATAALFAVARPQDGTVRREVTRNPPPLAPGLADAGTWLGNGAVLFPVMGAVYGAGWLAGSAGTRETGAEELEALSLGGAEALVLKYAAQRRRPDGSDRYSFPSGHATLSFAAASVLATRFGWPVGVPACLAAGFVGYTRLQNDKHWLSDVVAGAGLGVLAGRAVERARARKGRLTFAPWLAPGQAGVLVAVAL